MQVSGLVLAYGGDETEGAAALLHDAIEDQGSDARHLILKQCGPDVLFLVLECTEEGTGGAEKPSWFDRKHSYLNHLERSSLGALRISIADKLQSAQELEVQVRLGGDEPYRHFVKECHTLSEKKAAVLWFHQELVKSYQARLSQLHQKQPEKTLIGIEALLLQFSLIVQYLSA
jgi:(p)ppGpp synthase/HD superfamily hydrolase